MIDYKKLLITYMSFIISQNGTSYLNSEDYDKILNDEDKNKLKEIKLKSVILLNNHGLYEDVSANEL